jgi:hypothetical protein
MTQYCQHCAFKNESPFQINFCGKCGKPFGHIAAQTADAPVPKNTIVASAQPTHVPDDDEDGDESMGDVPRLERLDVHIQTERANRQPLSAIMGSGEPNAGRVVKRGRKPSATTAKRASKAIWSDFQKEAGSIKPKTKPARQ